MNGTLDYGISYGFGTSLLFVYGLLHGACKLGSSFVVFAATRCYCKSEDRVVESSSIVFYNIKIALEVLLIRNCYGSFIWITVICGKFSGNFLDLIFPLLIIHRYNISMIRILISVLLCLPF